MFSNRLKILRLKNKLSQEELSEKIGVKKGTISNYENKHSTPSIDILIKLANALSTSTDYLLGMDPEVIHVCELTNLELKLVIDEQELSEEEVTGMISFIRTYRNMIKHLNY